MPNDAKLGMVVGVALVIAVAVFFVHKDVPPPPTQAASSLNNSASDGNSTPPTEGDKPSENDQNP